MHREAPPIYASTLHRRDRVWGTRRRSAFRMWVRLTAATAFTIGVAILLQHLA